MLSARSRQNLIKRGHSLRSYLYYVTDSFDESLEKIRDNAGVARQVVAFSALVHIVTAAAVAPAYLPQDGAGFLHLLLWTSAAWIALVAWLLLHVGLLRNDDGVPEPSLRWANRLTILRFLLTVPVVVLILDGRWTAALSAYVICAASDVADGLVARHRAERTVFGRTMDPLADIVSNGAVFAALFIAGFLPLWVVVVLALRYASLFVGSLVLFLLLGPMRFDSTPTGKIVGVLQALAVIMIVALNRAGMDWRNLFGDIVFPFLGVIFGSVIVSQLVIAVRRAREGFTNVRS